jgi:hypothetical protein
MKPYYCEWCQEHRGKDGVTFDNGWLACSTCGFMVVNARECHKNDALPQKDRSSP